MCNHHYIAQQAILITANLTKIHNSIIIVMDRSDT